MTTTDSLTHTGQAVRWLGLTTAFSSLVLGGSLFAFSAFVMPALRQVAPADAVSAMQAINRAAPRSLLMLPLLGSAAGGAALLVLVLVRSQTPHRPLLVAGAVATLAPLVLTAVYHQPHNLALGRLDPRAPGTARDWAAYLSGWVRWNHARTVAALGGGVALAAGVWRR